MKIKCSYYITWLFALSIFFHCEKSFSQTWNWAKNPTAGNWQLGTGIAVDNNKNVYATGSFSSGSVTFGGITVNGAGGSPAVFVVKYDSLGNVKWARAAGGVNQDQGVGITADDFGHVYVTGYFESPSITFGSTTLINPGTFEMFLVKYDSLGNVVWAICPGGNGGSCGNSVTTDPTGKVYVTGYHGYFGNTMTFGLFTLNSTFQEIFVAKFDSMGTPIFLKGAAGTGSEQGAGIVADNNGYCYAAGMTQGADFSGTYIGAGGFLVKYSPTGNVVWGTQIGEAFDWANGIAQDPCGDLVLTGGFQNPTFTVGSTTLNNAGGGADIFVLKFDTTGNPQWVKGAGGANADWGYGIATNQCGNIYVTGSFASASITIGSTLTNATPGSNDIFVAQFDGSGNALWADNVGGGSGFNTSGTGVACDITGNAYVTGSFQSNTLTFGTHIVTSTFPSNANEFVAKLDYACTPTSSAITINPPLATICKGDTVTLVATSSATGYTWSPATGLNTITGGTVKASPSVTTTYTVTGAGLSPCANTRTVVITVNPTFTQNNPQTICSGSSYIFNGHTYTTTGNYNDTLSTITGCDSIIVTQLTVNPSLQVNNPQNICNGGSYTINSHTYTTTGNYSDTLSAVSGCDSIVITQLTVYPAVSLNNPQSLCQGEIYSINGHNYTVTGTYKDTLLTVNGCDSIITTQLTVNAVPVANAGTDITIDLGSSFQLMASGGTTYTWSPSLGLDNPNIASPEASPITTTTYVVTVTNASGCSDADTIIVTVNENISELFVPNVFAPEGNLMNRVLYVRGSGIKDLIFIVYDRWGEKVFESNSMLDGWDGTYKGKALSPAVFVYYVKAIYYNGDEVEKKGDVTLIR